MDICIWASVHMLFSHTSPHQQACERVETPIHTSVHTFIFTQSKTLMEHLTKVRGSDWSCARANTLVDGLLLVEVDYTWHDENSFHFMESSNQTQPHWKSFCFSWVLHTTLNTRNLQIEDLLWRETQSNRKSTMVIMVLNLVSYLAIYISTISTTRIP